jgi:hypothetical protein
MDGDYSNHHLSNIQAGTKEEYDDYTSALLKNKYGENFRCVYFIEGRDCADYYVSDLTAIFVSFAQTPFLEMRYENNFPYLTIILRPRNQNQHCYCSASRAVYNTFNDELKKGLQVDHINEVTNGNAARDLRQVTQRNNILLHYYTRSVVRILSIFQKKIYKQMVTSTLNRFQVQKVKRQQ